MTRLSRRAVALTLVPVLAAPALAQGKPSGDAPNARLAPPPSKSSINIPYERYTLPNGLTVVLSEDHTTPTVAVDVWYHVGSKNELPGRTGFAHLFEHVMFTGSGHVPYGMHDRLTQGVGGNNNGSTTNDRTNYYETVPANYLEAQMWMESDRMGFLLDSLNQTKLDAQRDVVKNERRQRVDNQPYGRFFELAGSAIYPEGHRYHWPVIGSMADLSAASLEDVKSFFRTNYAPNNATVTVVGDFDRKQAKALVSKYFGALPKGTTIVRPTAKEAGPVTLASEKRQTFQDRVPVARLNIVWPTVGETNPDKYALNALAAILAGPRTARLTKTLVYDRQWAASVNTFQNENETAGEFYLIATPRPGHTLSELELAADSIIEKVKRDGVTTDEVRRATAGTETGFVRQLESNLGKAEQLANGSVFHDNPGEYKKELAAYQAITPADVKRVANKYLTSGRLVLSIVPTGKLDQASKAAQSTEVK